MAKMLWNLDFYENIILYIFFYILYTLYMSSTLTFKNNESWSKSQIQARKEQLSIQNE